MEILCPCSVKRKDPPEIYPGGGLEYCSNGLLYHSTINDVLGKTSGFVREDMGSPETRNHSRMGSSYAPISPRLRELAHRLFLFPKSRPLPVSPGVTADISGIFGRTTGLPTQTSGPSGSSYRQELCQKCPLTAGTHRKTRKPRSRVFDSTERTRTFNLKRMKFLLHQLSYRAIC